MPPLSPPIQDKITLWPQHVQSQVLAVRNLCWDVARTADTGTLDESLKWGQPAWRPRAPRVGSTLRLNWTPETQDRLDLFVDCKTDLAARVTDLFPDVFDSDGRRRLSLPVHARLHADAVWHLVHATLTYHRRG